MNPTEGQVLALAELESAEEDLDGLIVIGDRQPDIADCVVIRIQIDASSFKKKPGGLPIKDTEEVDILIPPDFPFEKPYVLTPHVRFAGYPNVQFMITLCLYLSPDVDYRPQSGMRGFLLRLLEWLRNGARAEFDLHGMPLHPPVAYRSIINTKAILIPSVDTPVFTDKFWHGYAELGNVGQKVSDEPRIEKYYVTQWAEENSNTKMRFRAAVLLISDKMPFEYPVEINSLFETLEKMGHTRTFITNLLYKTAIKNQPGTSLIFILGTPMRGVSGSEEKKVQHLAAWYIPGMVADILREVRKKFKKDNEAREKELSELMEKNKNVRMDWCRIDENRPEATVRRDSESYTSFFNGKSILLLGCGAIGSNIAEYLVRAGISRITLVDKDTVSHGVLTRQNFEEKDIGEYKTSALKKRLERINWKLSIEPPGSNILNAGNWLKKWCQNVDIVIDATASNIVREFLEKCRKEGQLMGKPLASVSIDNKARASFLCLSGSKYTGGTADITRKTLIRLCDEANELFEDIFWPDERGEVFQPEPGCSEPTFRGSATDLAVLSGMLLNTLASELSHLSEEGASALLMTQPDEGIGNGEIVKYTFESDLVARNENTGYEIRIEKKAIEEMSKLAKDVENRKGRGIETGGVLYGKFDDAAGLVYVTEIQGPPPDSKEEKGRFVCGKVGVKRWNKKRLSETKDAVSYVGIWHTHPNQNVNPSTTDAVGMLVSLSERGLKQTKSVIIIEPQGGVGKIGAYICRMKKSNNSKIEKLTISGDIVDVPH